MASIAALLALSTCLFAAGRQMPPGGTHVRPLSPFIRALLVEGGRRSPTIADLLDRVARSPVVVYVESDAFLPVRGEVRFVRRSEDATVVAVDLNPRQTRNELIATLGHELQHVIEIASSPDPINSAEDLTRLYRRIGRAAAGGGFESESAIAAERATRADLATRRDVTAGASGRR